MPTAVFRKFYHVSVDGSLVSLEVIEPGKEKEPLVISNFPLSQTNAVDAHRGSHKFRD